MQLKFMLAAACTALISAPVYASPSLMQVFDGKSCDHVLDNGGFFKTCYSYQHKSPDRCWSRLDGGLVFKGNIKKRPSFYSDRNVPAKFRSYSDSYKYTKMDRGHLCASDASFDYSKKAQRSTYVMSQIAMQAPNSNRKSWLKIEKLGRQVAAKLGSLDVVTLSFYGKNPRKLGKDKISVAEGFGRMLTNDSKGYRKCFYMPNDNQIYKLKEMQVDCSDLVRKYRMQKRY